MHFTTFILWLWFFHQFTRPIRQACELGPLQYDGLYFFMQKLFKCGFHISWEWNKKYSPKYMVYRHPHSTSHWSWSTFEPPHDKTNKMTVCPVETQISLGVCPVWSESSLCTQWVAKNPRFLHADSEDSDQTGRMPRLIWVFAGRTIILLVLSWGGSFSGSSALLLIFCCLLVSIINYRYLRKHYWYNLYTIAW